ncbi:hypothetical protein [Desulfonema magnum]|uniref:Uncharacterized protein n=1 Tax=Desulfonema magnum TaxID=45655 RepID=A0A975GMN7_9BACT|nr:hypothetical protein [Desulfonema magnum]QTA86850.1 Uncharacterized protein dnm_028740 [Desulfonema magnum]
MKKQTKEYRRLPGKKRGFFGYNVLYLGSDHLLSVYSTSFSEDYKRFYYKDIQAIIIRKTAIGKISNIVACLSLAGFILLLFTEPPFFDKIIGITGGLFFLCLLINWLKGPTCICHLRTAVQMEKLPSLHRVKTARKVITLLRPKIEEVQGILPPEALTENIPKRFPDSLADRPDNSFSRHEHGKVHYILFCLLLVVGVADLTDLFYNHPAISLLVSIITMAICVCVIIALVKQHGSDMKKAVQVMTWITLGYACAALIFSYVFSFVTAIKHPGIIHNHWAILKMISALSPLDSPWLTGYYIFSICCEFILGISGLVLLKK